METSIIEFSIGPNSKALQDKIVKWLESNGFVVKNFSYSGDHYCEIDVYGDFNKFAKEWEGTKGLSYETWE